MVGVAGADVEVGGGVINEFNKEVAVGLNANVGVVVGCSDTKTSTGVIGGSTKVFVGAPACGVGV